MFPGHRTKGWYFERFADIIDYTYNNMRIVPVLVGSSEDRKAMEEFKKHVSVPVIDLCGKTGIGELYYIAKDARFFIGVDSGPSHIAAATGIPCAVLFSGVNDPVQWAPKGSNVRLIFPGKGMDLSGIQIEKVRKVLDEIFIQ
jgi:ADP-heptose:LPS heptosyltransferase